MAVAAGLVLVTGLVFLVATQRRTPAASGAGRVGDLPAPSPALPATAQYLATGPTGVVAIQWHRSGTAISGTARGDFLMGSPPDQSVSSTVTAVTGRINQNGVTVHFGSRGGEEATIAAGYLAVAFPRSDGSLVPVDLRSSTASQGDRAFARLRRQAASADQSARAVRESQGSRAAIDADIQAVNSATSTLRRDQTALSAAVGVLSGGLAQERTDLGVLIDQWQRVRRESARITATSPRVCADAAVVAADASPVVGDAGSVSGEAGAVQASVTAARRDARAMVGLLQQLNADERSFPSVRQHAAEDPDATRAAAAIALADAFAVGQTNEVIDLANSGVTSAYRDAASALAAGHCGPAPNPPGAFPHIS